MSTVGRAVTLLALSGAVPLAGQAPDLAALGPFLDSLLVAEDVPGVSLAVFDDNSVLFEHVAGVKSRRTDEPVDRETTFEAASISKPIFAYAVYALARDGLVDLDAPLTELVDDIPEVGYDPRAGSLTPRLLLSHRGGLPNWRARLDIRATEASALFSPADTLRFLGAPGGEYRYSGEGFVLLQRAVEQGLGLSLTDLAALRVFGPLGMKRSSMRFDDATRRNTTDGHDPAGNPDKWGVAVVPLASSTLHTTAADLARFGIELASQIRTGGPYAELAEPAVAVRSQGDRGLSWGLGLGIASDGDRRYVYHGGNNVIFIADLVYGVSENLGYAILTNSANGQRVVDALEERVFGRRLLR